MGLFWEMIFAVDLSDCDACRSCSVTKRFELVLFSTPQLCRSVLKYRFSWRQVCSRMRQMERANLVLVIVTDSVKGKFNISVIVTGSVLSVFVF